MEYVKLVSGVVIRVNDDGTTDWPYAPRYARACDGVPATKEDFMQQATIAWQVISESQALIAAQPEDMHDVVFAAVGYAALTFDATRGSSLPGHVRRTVAFAVASARARETAPLNAELMPHHAVENFIGQIDANVDINRYRTALSREQWLLLLARYDSCLSYEEIAREFRYGSRTTAKNKVEQALEICRRLHYQRASDTEKK